MYASRSSAGLTLHNPNLTHCDCGAGPVDVVLLEGWMLGFNPLPQVPLPDYVNRSDPNATHSVEADGTVAQQPAPVLSETELAAETMRRAEFEVAYNKANSIKVRHPLLCYCSFGANRLCLHQC